MPDPVGMLKVSDYEMPVVRLPEKLFSPGLHGKGIEMYALCAFVAPPGNGKRIPAEYMVEKAVASARVKPGGMLVEPTSGGMGVAMAYCAKKHNIKVVAIVSDKLPEGKLAPLYRHGTGVLKESEVKKIFGITEPTSSLELSRLYGEKTGAVFLNQYKNPWNPESWETTVAPQLWDLLGDRLTESFFAVGSTGTLRGLGTYFKCKNPNVQIIATMPYLTQDIAGTRDAKRLLEVAPWEHMADYKEQIDYRVARMISSDLFRIAGIPAGESSGAAVGMADHYYLDQLARGTLKGNSVAVMVFLDTFVPYVQMD